MPKLIKNLLVFNCLVFLLITGSGMWFYTTIHLPLVEENHVNKLKTAKIIEMYGEQNFKLGNTIWYLKQCKAKMHKGCKEKSDWFVDNERKLRRQGLK